MLQSLKAYTRWVVVTVLICVSTFSYATHNRAGEITFAHVSGLKYLITVTTYTVAASCQADRCELTISYGDGEQDTIQRVNGFPCSGGCEPTPCGACGEIIANDIKKNVYTVEHTFSGPGIYKVSVEDPNRNANIHNIPSSVNVTFFIESELIIYPGTSFNASPVLQNPPIDNGCVGLPFEHNPGAVDPDGDSLVYTLVSCLGTNGNTIVGFTQPNVNPDCPGGSLSIDAQTGTLIWESPSCSGAFNFAILITEYRNGVKIGTVLRDMQVNIETPCMDEPPQIQTLLPLCVIAGTTVDFDIVTTDPNSTDNLTFDATGELFQLDMNPATFINASGTSPVTTHFNWLTDCEHVRSNPYHAVIKADDNHVYLDNMGNVTPFNLVDFETIEIRVIAPPVQNPDAAPFGNTIQLNWDPNPCTNATCYKIYRHVDSLGFTPDSCQTGVPGSTGYTLIGTTYGWSSTSYTDNSPALVLGQQYCYLIVACFEDGSESIASEEFCAELRKEFPIITHVSVFKTDISNGADSIVWAKPTELDTTDAAKDGPYHYKIYRSQGFGQAGTLIGMTNTNAVLAFTDTIWIDTLINTKDHANTYTVALFSDTLLIGYSHLASSVFLSSSPTDNALNLSWSESVPWTNYEYDLYKADGAGNFTYLTTTQAPNYLDTGLVNGTEYCYYVKSKGKYSTTGIVEPLINHSQIHCNRPIDNVAPCPPPHFDLNSSCELFENILSWTKPDVACADDVVGYKIYYKPQPDSYWQLLTTVGSGDTTFPHLNLESVAGCYSVSVIDTIGNESLLSDTACADNCPFYELPNVFSPGGDGYNDLFRPFPYRYVEYIDLTIYNRWGNVLFKTRDPDVKWNGINQSTSQWCTSGVYYYVCQVYEITLTGLKQRQLSGYVHLIWEHAPGAPAAK